MMIGVTFLVIFVASSFFGNVLAQDGTCDPVNFREFQDFDVTLQAGTTTQLTGNYSGTPGFRARVDFQLKERGDNNFPLVPLKLVISQDNTHTLEVRFKFGGGRDNLVRKYISPLLNSTEDIPLIDIPEPVISIVVVAFPEPGTNDTVHFTVDRLEACINPPIVVVKGEANFTTICSGESMKVEVDVADNFTGLVYPEGFANNDSCTFTNSTNDHFVKTFFFNSTDCGASWKMIENFWEFSAKTVVQFNQEALYPSDQSHLSRCVFDNTFTINDFVTSDKEEPKLREGNDTTMGNVTSFLFFGILDEDRDTSLNSSSEVKVGSTVHLRVQLKKNPVFSTVLVKNCIASNRPDKISLKYVWLQLIDEKGCPATDVLIPERPTYDVKSGDIDVTVKVKAFLFVEGRDNGRNELHFACDAMLCPPGNDTCVVPTTCPNSRRRRSVDSMEDLLQRGHSYVAEGPLTSVQASRQRRAVEEDKSNVVTLGGSVKVVVDSERTDDQVDMGTPDLNDYMQHPEVQAIIVVLGVLLLALLITSITLAVILYRRYVRRKRKDLDDVRSSTSSVRRMITPTTFIPHVQAFAAPMRLYGSDAYTSTPETTESRTSSLSSTKKAIY